MYSHTAQSPIHELERVLRAVDCGFVTLRVIRVSNVYDRRNIIHGHCRKYYPTTSSPQTAMSKDRDIGRPSSPWSSYSQQFQKSGGSQAHLTVSTEANYQGRALLSAQSTSSSALPTRPDMPIRSSTDPSRAYSSNNPLSFSNSRSEDLNHQRSSPTSNIDILSSSPRPLAQLHSSAAANSRPSTPGTSKHPKEMSSSSHSDHTPHSELSSNSKLPSTSSSTAASIAYTYVFSILPSFSQISGSHSYQVMFSMREGNAGSFCKGPRFRVSSELLQMHGRHFFSVYLLDSSFHFKDCGEVVASKFFPIDGSNGKQNPLCERDYFRRLNLICEKCGMALRGSYITACSTFLIFFFQTGFDFQFWFRFSTDKKYHVDHFTCSLCSTLFGPQDSYYEHDNDVYCHFHYSTRFATKCAGCNSAILKQFVEINRNMRDECWHPECYMINKVRLLHNIRFVTLICCSAVLERQGNIS